jgi:3-oxoacyl-[acyl-carrier-protein] synthase II
MRNRVAITGLGVVTPFGRGVTNNWAQAIQGKCGIRKLSTVDATGLRVQYGGEIPEQDMATLSSSIDSSRMDRSVLLAIDAAHEALKAAGLGVQETGTTGVVVGTGFGTIQTKERHFLQAANDDRAISPLIVLQGMDNAAASEIAIRFGLKGINQTLFTACSSGAMAIGTAYRLIVQGYETRLLAGGVDTPITRLMIKAWDKLHLISRGRQWDQCSLPFGRNRNGFTIAEGAGFLVLENLTSARSRGAVIYAELAGFSANCDAQHLSTPDANTQANVVRSALDDAKIASDQVQYINAHGTATTVNDQVETQAIKLAFGAKAVGIPISATKSQIGHTMGASGAIEAIFTVLMMRSGCLLPTIHFQSGDPLCDLDYVPNQVRKIGPIQFALKTAFGFGGNNVALVLRNADLQ